MERMNVSILPAGSFGSALGEVAARNGHNVTFYTRSRDVADEFNATHEFRRSSGVKFLDTIYSTADLDEAVCGKNLLVIAVPSVAVADFYTDVAKAVGDMPNDEKPMVLSVIKALSGEKFISDVLEDIDAGVSERLSIISGPNLAAEILHGIRMATVIASTNNSREQMRAVFGGPAFRIYTEGDIKAVQAAGALKNVVSIALGICEGAGVSEAERKELLKQGTEEIVSLGMAMGATREAFYHMSALVALQGDLRLSTSGRTRNFQLGLDIGKGANVSNILASSTTLEGLYTLPQAISIARREDVSVPLMEATYLAVFGNMEIKDTMNDFRKTIANRDLTRPNFGHALLV